MAWGTNVVQNWLNNHYKTKAKNTSSVTVETDVFSNSFAYVKGRMFGAWIDLIKGSVRSNGYNIGDLIENPAYIIESLLRDENFVERDLKITSVGSSGGAITVNGLASNVDDYYNYAIYINAKTGWVATIDDYVGSSKVLYINPDSGAATGDNISIINVRGDYKIDYASFDAIGNTTTGSLNGWKFARSFTSKRNINDILSELCFESHCELIESIDSSTGEKKYKLVYISNGSGDTWTNPAYVDGLEQIKIEFTPLENIFTQFRLKYFYDYGKGDFTKEIYVDKNGYPASATLLGATDQARCSNAESTYNLSRLFEYSSYNIYDDLTAENFLINKIYWYTKQRLIVKYVTPIVGNKAYIKYEKGDRVKLDFSKGIPAGINNSSMFIITSKRVVPLIGGGHIIWELLEL